MTDRRQAFRREPIEVDLGGEVISIAPIPWLRRNDFGNEIMRQHSQILNEALQLYVTSDAEDAVPQIEAKFAEKFTDPFALFKLGLDEPTYERLKELGSELYDNQIVEILLAICDVNKLNTLHPLIDPNSLTPSPVGGVISQLVEGEGSTPKTESGPDSSQLELVETPSSS